MNCRRTKSMWRFTVRVLGCLFIIASVCTLSYAHEQKGSVTSKQKEFAVARKTLRHAAEIAVTIKEPIGKVHVLSWIAVSQARVEDVQGALKTAAKIGDPKSTVLATADIASFQAELGQGRGATRTFQQARSLTGSLKDIDGQAYALGKIAQLQARAQDKTGATQTFQEALDKVNSMPADHYRGSALFYLGTSQMEMDRSEAAATFREASRFLSREDFRSYVTAMELVPFQARAGDYQGALETAELFSDENSHTVSTDYWHH